MGGYRLGVDLGTTFTAVAVERDGRAEIVSLGHHAAAIPSLVFLRDDGSWLVGDPAGRRGLAEPGRLAREFKRRFGDTTPILLGGTPWSADALTSQLLRYVVAEATAMQGSPPDGVAVTHPANWGPYKIDLLHQAVRAAGLPGDTPVLLTEPEAAALHYASTERVEPGEMVAIYDLGGGTFDATVLTRTADGFTLVGEPEGIERLGGIDFDEAVMAHVAGFLGSALSELDPDDPAALAAMARLRSDCTVAKEALSADTEVSIPILLPTVQTEIRLTRAEFEAMIRPTLAETISALERALRSTGAGPERLKAVLLVGGSSRIPLVGQLVGAAIGRPVAVDVHPKHAVALGAALAAAGSEMVGAPVAVPAAPVELPAPPPDRTVRQADAAPAPGRPRKRLPLILAGVALVAVVGVVAFLLTRGGDGEEEVLPPEVPTFKLESYPRSVAVGEGSVWVATTGPGVLRFSASEERVVVGVPVGREDGPLGIAVGAGSVWVADSVGGTLVQLDPATNSVISTLPIGRKPHSVVVAAGAVWVSVEEDGIVARVDPATRAITRIQVRGTPTYLAYSAGTLWVTDLSTSNLARVDTATGTVLGSADSGGCPGRIAADDNVIWVQDECKESTVFQVDPTSGRVVGQVTVGQDARGLVLAKGSLWVVNSDDGTVSQVDVATRSVKQTIRVGPSPDAIAADGDSVWVTNTGDATLSRIRL